MPAIICHHIFGEDAAAMLPEGMIDGEEELLAFLLGSQGPDPLFARFSTLPNAAAADHRLAHQMHDERCGQALESWILWEKRRATVLERPAHMNLMRTERICRVAGALFSQAAFSVYGRTMGAEEYGACVADYEFEYRMLDPAGSPMARAVGALERIVKPHSFAQAMAHRVVRSCECAAANLDRRGWSDPTDGCVRHESFADLFEEALAGYPELAEAFVRGNIEFSLNYNGVPEA